MQYQEQPWLIYEEWETFLIFNLYFNIKTDNQRFLLSFVLIPLIYY